MKARRDWIVKHVLMPLEDNYQRTFTERQIAFWVEFFDGWGEADILKALAYVMRDCKFLPTASDWSAARPAVVDYVRVPDEPVGATLTRLERKAPDEWSRVVVRETLRGLKAGDMRGAYRRLAEEAEKRNLPDAALFHDAERREPC